MTANIVDSKPLNYTDLKKKCPKIYDCVDHPIIKICSVNTDTPNINNHSDHFSS